MGSPLPENEVARLEALRSCRVLDTPPEQAFDDLTQLTSYICGTPIAFIGFMDAERLWLKSRTGWDAPEIPREMSFCAYTILQNDVVVIPDTLADYGRLATCPLAAQRGIRFYAAAPLVSSDGYVLGTLAAMDSIPRGLTPYQVDALRRLGHQVVALVEGKPVLRPVQRAGPAQPNGGPSGDTRRVLGYSFWRDLSTQKRTWEALRHSEQRLQGIIGSAMDAIITVDSNQRIVVFNKAAEQIFRCTTAEALGQPLDKFIPERFRVAHRQHIQEFGKTGVTTRSMFSPGSLFAVRADGEEFPIEATISQIETDEEKLFTVILRDIGARRRMEEELRQAQKMEAVGQMAGGIAHEFNNFLGVVLGFSELLSDEAATNERLGQCVTEIKAATQHAASLTHQLLAFSRKQVLTPQVLDLNRCIWDAHNLMRRLVSANIEVVPMLAPDIGRVKADPSQVQQILINLLVNARDAMPQGGKVVIETADVELDEPYTSQHVGLLAGSYVLLSVSDSGLGMSAETRSHLFEPFYTTKEPGKGTGLGLSTVYGIVRRSGGHINVESIEGKGTTFRIYLPRLQETAEEPPVPATPQVAHAGPAAILIVEDETALRRLLCLALQKKRHVVYAAKDGVEALDVFREHGGEIQLLITDLMMPRMDGIELKKRIAALRADVKFLFMSGYAEQVLEQHPGALEGIAFLEKPFLPEELAAKVGELLAPDAAALEGREAAACRKRH